MMRRLFFILVVLLSAAGRFSLSADDALVDDVYYWAGSAREQQIEYALKPAREQQKEYAPAPVREERVEAREQRVEAEETAVGQENVQVIFVEDSITQQSDTVVRAIIRRTK